MRANFKEKRLQETRAKPSSQQAKRRTCNGPAHHVQKNHGQDIPRSGAERDSNADFPGLLSDQESNDAVDPDPRKQDAYAREQ